MKHEAAKRARKIVSGFLFASALLVPGTAQSASGVASGQLAVQYKPEVALSLDANSVRVKIRMLQGAEARVWTDTTCTSPKADSQIIPKSGNYSLPVSAAEPDTTVCLASSDGLLMASIPLK